MRDRQIRVLLIEDNAGDARLLREMLRDSPSLNCDLTCYDSIGLAVAHLLANPVDIVLLDLGLPDAEGLGALRRAHAAAPKAPLVVLTGFDDESLAMQAMQEGAQDYLIKGQIETRTLARAMRYAIERKATDDMLLAEKERAEATLNSIGDAVVSADLAGAVTFVNPVAESITGWSAFEAVGHPLADVIRIVDTTTRESVAKIRDALGGRPTTHLRANSALVRRDGTEIPVEGTMACIYDRGGEASGEVMVFRDVSAARATSLQIAHSAQHDFLTGLPNRILLNDRISNAIAIAPRHNKKVAVLFLDLDGFKHINDTLGHAAGDRLLQSVGQRLLGCVRGSDTVSRQGGDEFVVLLSEIENPEDAAITARRMLEAVATGHNLDGQDLHVTTSVGVAVYPDDGDDAATLIKSADTAMYQAKENGRHGYQFFRPVMNTRAVERQDVEQSLRHALERDEFALHYQAKINLRTGQISGAEALIRWTHPTRGELSPTMFVPVAEACGLIGPIGHWVLGNACRQASAWHAAGLSLPSISVNVSSMEFQDTNFLESVFTILSDTGLDPGALELELTEAVLMKHANSSESTLRSLRALGVQLAIDDFGTGYSSLSNLRKFPLDTLKIDQSFVRQITTIGEDRSIVHAVLNMARSLELRAVAEGVETPEELSFLQANECDEAQGYYFSRPLPAKQFARLLQSGIVPTMAERRYEAHGARVA